MTKALETIPVGIPERHYERELSARFENGGGFEITVRGESVGEVLSILCSALDVIPLNPDRILNFELRYWHLSEDCATFEISSTATEADPFDQPINLVIREMINRTRTEFVRKLASVGVTLTGHLGKLS